MKVKKIHMWDSRTEGREQNGEVHEMETEGKEKNEGEVEDKETEGRERSQGEVEQMEEGRGENSEVENMEMEESKGESRVTLGEETGNVEIEGERSLL